MRVKEISWNVLLRFGDPETLALFTLALEDEETPLPDARFASC
jgi:hypothetical protein